MAAQIEDTDDKKKARKEALKAKATELGISYKDLKAQKKAVKEQKKMTRETEALQDPTEKKRMRSWSKDLTEPEVNGDTAKRRRTRSMDAKEEEATKSVPSNSVSSEDWRKQCSITIQGHGKYKGQAQSEFDDPFLTFKEVPFCDAVHKTFSDLGYAAPTEIQSQAWPIAIKGEDMICIAKTGSGKTCGFLLPSFHQHMQNNVNGQRGAKNPMLLVLAPTRELACQIMEETNRFGRPIGITSLCCYGGSSKWPQIAALQRGVDCVIATPGRLNDLLEMGKVNLSQVKFLVLDEADRMLDMGFEPQIRSIIKNVPDARQTLLFSATWPREIQNLAHDFLTNPIQVNVGEVNALNANKDIKQHIMMCSEGDKHDKLIQILKDLTDQGIPAEETPTPSANGRSRPPADMGGKKHAKVIIFTARKITCSDLANQLWDDGFAVDCLHGDRAQWERTKVINAFKSGALRMLTATDVAARGLDVKDVGVVVNFDMPGGTNAVEDYVHRIGRTGRAGAKGIAYTFFTQKDSKCATQLVEVMKKAEQEIPPELQAMVRTRFGGGGGRFRGGRGGGRGGGGRGRGGRGGYMGGGGGRGGGGRRW
eukprot:CAMPEP_0198251390 /NCGR_PEP_ID=MMETSP1447-20131203/2232_1 /TAXON_ID=420782 /ORGANISM="Chaetoceros dichaeta, Strain CCMP1751" /LENGTH=593 /DNA_ID=CAMNT_0043936389 /DNA_START=39 /DNA_END=1820 /DNA_ORIENTATION=+